VSDLTQQFFTWFLAKEEIKLADPSRGRLRHFLIVMIKNFLADEWGRAYASRRGHGRSPLSIEQIYEAEPYLLTLLVDPAPPPDRALEQQWAFSVLACANAKLRQECADIFGLQKFEALAELGWVNPAGTSRAEVAIKLGNTPNAAGVAVYRLLRRYGEFVRASLAETGVGPAEMEGELRYLLSVVKS